MELATCAFCGTQAATSTMDLTGHGLRCARCALAAEQARLAGHDPGMREHLTGVELQQVVREGTREVGFGTAALAVAALTLFAGTTAGLPLLVVGLGLTGHGLHRRRMAKRALGDAPTARVVRR